MAFPMAFPMSSCCYHIFAFFIYFSDDSGMDSGNDSDDDKDDRDESSIFQNSEVRTQSMAMLFYLVMRVMMTTVTLAMQFGCAPTISPAPSNLPVSCT